MLRKFIILTFFILMSTAYAYDTNDKVILQKDFSNETVYLPLNSYRTLKFEKKIKNINLTNSKNIHADFIDSQTDSLKLLKVVGTNIGNESAIVTFTDSSTMQINFNIMQNLDSIISLVKSSYPNLIIEQANSTILLRGFVKDYKEKNVVLEIFKKAGVDLDKQLIDTIETSSPSSMIRIKLYAVEINIDDGLDLKNNWVVSSRNYMQAVNEDGLYYNVPNSQTDSANAQRDILFDNALSSIMTNAASLSGGLTGVANYLGRYFNAGLILQYLETKGVANLLDETTLVTLEDKNAVFHAGGTIRVKTQGVTAEGLLVTTLEAIDYGLKLDIKAKNIMDEEYVDLEIKTSSTQLDWANQVDDIPALVNKNVLTHVIAKNQSTIVLGGLINNENSYDMDKIPLIGDIPILGKLFTSKSFVEGRSELVFFITPEVINPKNNDETKLFKKRKKEVLDVSKYRDRDREVEEDKETKPKEISVNPAIQSKKPTKEEVHKARVDEILGY